MTTIENAVAMVTGGQRGLGEAFADELLRRGAAKVYVTAREPRPSTDPRIEAVRLDVTDEQSVSALAERAPDTTLVVNNAGVLHPTSLLTGPRVRRAGPVSPAEDRRLVVSRRVSCWSPDGPRP